MNISEYANRENDEPLVGLIYVGNSNSKIAAELEADALRFGFEITDTIMDETHPIDMLKWYMKNTSIMAVLVRDILDISSDKEVLLDVLNEAERQGVRIHSKVIGVLWWFKRALSRNRFVPDDMPLVCNTLSVTDQFDCYEGDSTMREIEEVVLYLIRIIHHLLTCQ